MDERERVPREETVYRAITEANTDGNRIYSAAFRSSAEISLCRGKFFPLGKIISIFHRDVKEPVIFVGQFTVAQIEDAGANFKKGPANKQIPAPFPLTVVADPERCNPSHAVIPQLSMPENLAKQLAKVAIRHSAGKRTWWHIVQRRIQLALDRLLPET